MITLPSTSYFCTVFLGVTGSSPISSSWKPRPFLPRSQLASLASFLLTATGHQPLSPAGQLLYWSPYPFTLSPLCFWQLPHWPVIFPLSPLRLLDPVNTFLGRAILVDVGLGGGGKSWTLPIGGKKWAGCIVWKIIGPKVMAGLRVNTWEAFACKGWVKVCRDRMAELCSRLVGRKKKKKKNEWGCEGCWGSSPRCERISQQSYQALCCTCHQVNSAVIKPDWMWDHYFLLPLTGASSPPPIASPFVISPVLTMEVLLGGISGYCQSGLFMSERP